MVLGGAVAYVLHLFRPIVVSSKGLEAFTNARVLGTVGVAFPRRAQRSARLATFCFSSAAAVLFLLFVTTLVLNWSGVRLTSLLFKDVVGT
jgi:hypothetical protein